MNITTADSHVGEVERSIRTIKERLRACVHGLPFRRLPKVVIVAMISDCVRCLNQFPRVTGISSTMSPSTIVRGTPPPDFNAMRIEFGAYAQVFEDHDPTNTPRGRSLGAIALNPTGNTQGDYYFLSLSTGARISRHAWTELPLPDTAIARVEAIALHEGRPLIQERGFVIEWRPDHVIDDSEYDLDFVEPNTHPTDVFETEAYDPIDAAELGDLLDDAPPAVPADAPAAAPAAPDQGANADEGPEPMQEVQFEYANIADIAEDDNFPDQDDEAQRFADQDEAEHFADQGAPMDEDQGAPPLIERAQQAPQLAEQEAPGTYNLRPRGQNNTRDSFNAAMDAPHDGKSYYPPTQLLQKAMGLVAETDMADEQRFAFNFILVKMATTCTQMTERAGLHKHGKAAEAALMAEFSQLEGLDVYEALDATKLTRGQRKAALRAINLFKEKRNGKLKGRTCADGRSQRPLYDKSQTASPTVSNDALLLTIIIEALENRDVATADVVGAYLKAYMDDFVIMKFVGESVRLLCELNPAHIPFVVKENGVDVLYVRLIKALYGCVKSALLWYELFAGTLQEMGFVLNPYDPCVANCDINGKQCTIAWYVDDTKISHVDPDVVTDIVNKLEERFDKMTVTRGREHVFLGMKIRYTEERTAIITMKDYLKEAITGSGLDITKTASTPANGNLFKIDDKSPLLDSGRAEIFHSVVAKLLYVALRARVDILLPIAFLCTRVSKSTLQDEAKLKRVLEYIACTMEQKYTIGADDLEHLRTWVDASYAVHPDMRSHTGGCMSFGIGAWLCKSMKHKLNTRSSTEAETVGASDYMPNMIWIKNFLEAQGYFLSENVLEQDNESAIKLEKNGRLSAGPKSRHIDIRYFWMKDRIKTENITIRHCPTLQMVADFFTKPLQGSLFRKFRDVIMGDKRMDTISVDTPMPLEERVGENVRSDDSVVNRNSNCDSNSTERTVRPADVEKTKAAVKWADAILKSASSTASTKREAALQIKNRVFREEIILSKQSSV